MAAFTLQDNAACLPDTWSRYITSWLGLLTIQDLKGFSRLVSDCRQASIATPDATRVDRLLHLIHVSTAHMSGMRDWWWEGNGGALARILVEYHNPELRSAAVGVSDALVKMGPGPSLDPGGLRSDSRASEAGAEVIEWSRRGAAARKSIVAHWAEPALGAIKERSPGDPEQEAGRVLGYLWACREHLRRSYEATLSSTARGSTDMRKKAQLLAGPVLDGSLLPAGPVTQSASDLSEARCTCILLPGTVSCLRCTRQAILQAASRLRSDLELGTEQIDGIRRAVDRACGRVDKLIPAATSAVAMPSPQNWRNSANFVVLWGL